jgi:RNA polymerase sigma-70 factor (ECF subfamily)
MLLPVDRELLLRAQRGDAQAFEQLIRPHLPSLRRFAYSFARRWVDADDLAQEALLKAFRSLKSFEGRSSLSTWLYTVTRSVGHDLYRSRQVQEGMRHEELDEVHVAPGESADSQLSAQSDAEQLWRAIKRLEPEFRVPLVLFEIEGLSYEEIAAIEHVPLGTIRSRISRARSKLRELLLERESFLPPEGTSRPASPSDPARRP